MNQWYVDCLPVTGSNYRGVDRPWDFDGLSQKRPYDERKWILDMLLAYDALSLAKDDIEKLKKMIKIKHQFLDKGITCEVIVSSPEPIEQLSDFDLAYLGIDITNQFGESLLLETANYLSNENGLVEEQNIRSVLSSWQGDNNHVWSKEYVYLVVE